MSSNSLCNPYSQTLDGLRAHGTKLTGVALLIALLAGLFGLLSATPAQAAARVDVAPVPSADGPTTVTLSGSGFQYQPNAPGGIYVFFGTVSDPMTNSWAPSQGGRSGTNYAYAGTSGTQLLAAFDGGSSAESANGVIDANGNWTAQMTIPGSTFAATFGDPHSGQDQSGQTINCLEVQCGIITVGAHGLINANNESFTPISFQTSSGQQSGTGTVDNFTEGAVQNQPENSTNDSAAAPTPQETQINDEAVTLEVPGEETEASDNQNAQTQEATPQATQENAGAVTPEALENQSGSSTATWIILGILIFAVLVLVVATTLVLAKRSQTKKSAAHHDTFEA